MKTNIIATIAAAAILPLAAFAQTPPTPPVPPVPPVAPVPPAPPHGHDRDHDRGPKVPVTYLGVETSEVPTVVAEQLGLAKGFGLVVDYVVADGPAAAAGVQQNDILKLLNDQILTEPDQLAKLVRSFPEGTNVTLTVLRKGAETKLTAKLAKREVPQRQIMREWGKRWKHGEDFSAVDLSGLEEQMKNFHIEVPDLNLPDMTRVKEEAARAREEARRAQHEARDRMREAAREARRAARELRVTRRDNGGLKTTRIDMGRAQIVYHDAAGELKIERIAGRKVLTAKDPQGRLIFSGPVETKEELDKVPADVRQRYEKIEQKDLPNVVTTMTSDEPNVQAEADADAAADAAADADDDNDAEDDNDELEDVVNVSAKQPTHIPYRQLGLDLVLI